MLSNQMSILSILLLVITFCLSPVIHKVNAQEFCCEEKGFHRHENLTNDWWKVQPSLEEQGITFGGSVTQFYQGVASGGRDQIFRYGGSGEYSLGFDFGKLVEVEGFKLKLGAEHRFGKSINEETGSVNPSALPLNLPEPETDHLALTKVLFSQEFSENVEVFFGKISTLEFDTNAFADGAGRKRFFSTPFNYNPVATRTIPFSTLGVGFNFLNEGERIFTLVVLNTEETATTSGFDQLFANGAAIMAEWTIPTHLFGRAGHHRFAGSWSSRTFDSLEQFGRIDFPDIPIDEQQGSWSLLWNFDQFIWEDPQNESRGWGLFGRAGISDGNPNPVKAFLSLGVGGSSLLPGRENDTFGIGWYYTDISNQLGTAASAVLRDGQGIELYYSIAISESFHITPDLQIIQPNIVAIDTAIVPGLRARIDF